VSQKLNTRARLERAVRNNVEMYSATETFRQFKWFTLGLIILIPIYPSLSFIGSDQSAHASDYDESSIITAYSDLGTSDGYISESGLVSLAYRDTQDTGVLAQAPTISESGALT
jgi:hypothetical protein